MNKKVAIPVTDKMIPVTKEDMVVGAKLLIVNDIGNASEQQFRGRMKSEKEFRVFNMDTGEDEWVNEEPDYSYGSYLRTLKFLFKKGRILKYK